MTKAPTADRMVDVITHTIAQYVTTMDTSLPLAMHTDKLVGMMGEVMFTYSNYPDLPPQHNMPSAPLPKIEFGVRGSDVDKYQMRWSGDV